MMKKVQSKTEDKYIKRKNRIKIVRVIFQFLVLGLVATLFVKLYFFPKEYEEPDKTLWTQRNGFIALSYVGVAQNKNYQLVSREKLDAHLKALKEAGYVTIGIDDVIDFYYNGGALPDKALYIMFEDGRKDSIIFTERLLRKQNFKATMMNYASNVVNKDEIFIKKRELNELTESTYWDVGSNGYRFSYINVIEALDLEDIDEDGDYNKLYFDYNHYLMDYLRDNDGIPVETTKEMTERINWDYQMMEQIYTEAMGYIPKSYVIMHAGGIFGNTPQAVQNANLENIYRMFDVMFNQEGSCYNGASRNPYNLTRMQVSPDWSVNNLIMQIELYTDSGIPFVVDEATLSRLDVTGGVVNTENKDIILTTEKGSKTTAVVKGTDNWDDLSLKIGLGGSETGRQSIVLRQTADSYIKINIKDFKMTIEEKAPGKEPNVLYDMPLYDGGEIVQDVEDTFDLERVDEQTEYYEKVEQNETFEIRKRTMASGLEQIIWDIEVSINGNNMTVIVNDIELEPNILRIDPNIKAGSISLEAYEEDEIYDGIFIDLDARLTE